MRHLSSVLPSFPLSKLTNLHASLISFSPFPNLFIFWHCGCKLCFSIYNRVCDVYISLFPSGSFARPGRQRNEVGEMRAGSQHGVSVSADLLLPVYWIDADQSTATSRPCRPRWPEEETPLQFLEHESFVFEPSDIWRFRTRLASHFTTEVGWFTLPLSIFGSDFYSLFLSLLSIREITGKD